MKTQLNQLLLEELDQHFSEKGVTNIIYQYLETPMIIEIEVNQDSNEILIPLSDFTWYIIDWADGQTEEYLFDHKMIDNRVIKKEYKDSGNYRIKIYSDAEKYTNNSGGLLLNRISINKYYSAITKIISFGTLPLVEVDFSDCDNLISVPDQLPATVTNSSNMFSNCYKFNQSLKNWNTSNVINMRNMFFYATSFNQNLSGWNVNKVIQFNRFCQGSSIKVENQPIFWLIF